MGSLGQPMEGLPVAQLDVIDYSRLSKNDTQEVQRLLKACTQEGFFYLDLSGGDSRVLSQVDRVYAFMEEWLGQSHEEKMKNYQTNYTDGYKPTGYFAGVDDKSRDNSETLKVSHKAFTTTPPSLPQGVQKHGDMLHSYLDTASGIAIQLLSALSDGLGLKDSERFEAFHADREDSNSTLVLLKYPYIDPATRNKQVGHNKHTDIGSITMLFTDQWGLQVMRPGSDKWEYIEPSPSCAIINVGDCLRFLSQKKLLSCLHRVVPAEGSTADRNTIAYFLRPSNKATFVDSNGELSTAADWHDRKYEVFRSTHDDQRKDTILTGGLEAEGKLSA
ncbi:gibberellin 20-oxidase family protein [Aspergillus campestris IBT 28561]|uniref:Gibberellin 20-oxidase family protein n=1 Tax=Aspergillus campestris (strain IBT 28561) TaxID=1392248 RepID=A0A2I1D2I4_ASPC2|nr:gibberellin 20-oxidase family protein [Aspergillus campestris IBT 28561]PKY04102.1 gibberellin 20-oxidase family protein [Aspergillus campestris IBT 28561]